MKTPENKPQRPGLSDMLQDESGTTTLEWAILLGGIALPCVYLFTMLMSVMVDYYRMMTQLSGLAMP